MKRRESRQIIIKSKTVFHGAHFWRMEKKIEIHNMHTFAAYIYLNKNESITQINYLDPNITIEFKAFIIINMREYV